jgi:cytochrome c-type biogenesis protein CcmF
LDFHAEHMDGRRNVVQQTVAGRNRRARSRRNGVDQHRLPSIHAPDIESVHAAGSRRADGRDLNPLLQDPAMVAHPPMLYMGYVGMSVVFAFAISALISGRLDATWARWSRPWTTVAWMFLTCGIALGSFWAYYELGWGGWWFWDPVENASFMPWLVGTALIHSLAVTEKRGGFKSWTVLMAIAAFSLSLLGTFLVRSGVLTSVHAFASDPKRGIFILIFLIVVIGGSLTLVRMAR